MPRAVCASTASLLRRARSDSCEGQEVEVDPSAVPGPVLPTADIAVQFGVVYEDDTVIVVDKPAGLVVHPGAGNLDGTLVSGLLARYPDIEGVGEDPVRPGIVHRLDAGSSGLLVVARTDEAAEHLIDQFADHSATRRYDAVVWGVPDAPHGIIDAPIGRDRGDPLKMAVVAGRAPGSNRLSGDRHVLEPGRRCHGSNVASRRAARTRSVSTWRRSIIRWSAIRPTANVARRSG